ncbi:MAG: helix-turn-helix transcriptional regulator [Pseudomonadota bacterium]
MADASHEDDWYDPEATTFGDRLTGAREAASLSQAELARRIGVTLRTLRAWESDRSEPRANRVSILAGVLNVSLMWLLSGEGDGPLRAEQEPDEGDSVLIAELSNLRRDTARLSERIATLEARLRARLGV